MVWGIRQKADTPTPPPDVDRPVTRDKLPTKLQHLVNKDEDGDFYDDLYSP
jgi:hypothetical protein